MYELKFESILGRNMALNTRNIVGLKFKHNGEN